MKPRSTDGLPAAAAVGVALAAGYGLARWFRSRPEADGRYRPRRAPGGKRVVILGAGFGGLTTAMALARLVRDGTAAADITLVDRINVHLFTPMLYQVATGLVEPGNIAYPVRAIARRHGFNFREAEVSAIDLDRRRVVCDDGELSYDALVLALGSTTNYFGNASVQVHAASLKTLRDAVHIRNRLLDAFERADVESDPEARRRWLTFVVVGGGATGVELIGSMHSLVTHGMRLDYPSIDPSEVRLVLAEASPGILGGMDPWMGETALRHLRAKGIEVSLGNLVTEVSDDGVRFKDGTFIPSRTVVWAAGVRPAPLTAELPVEKGRDGRILVDEYLQVKGRPGVYALGDCAWFPVQGDDGKPAPPNAQTAVREATVVAHNVAAELHGGARQRYEYANEGSLVALGQGDGVADLRGFKVEGFPAWLIWRSFYLSELMGFKNRLGVLVDWFSAYFVQRDTAKLDVGTGPSLAEAPRGVRAKPAGGGGPASVRDPAAAPSD
jgi:NADH:ubiquinone reductase (H+-translocating)